MMLINSLCTQPLSSPLTALKYAIRDDDDKLSEVITGNNVLPTQTHLFAKIPSNIQRCDAIIFHCFIFDLQIVYVRVCNYSE